MLALLMTAYGADALPGLVNPSAAPLNERVMQVEANGGLGVLPGEAPGFGATVQGTVRLSPRWRVGGAMGGLSFPDPLVDEDRIDGAVNAGYLLVDDARVRVMPWVAVGSYTQAGVAVWWRLSEHVTVDASGGPALITAELNPWQSTWKAQQKAPPFFEYHPVSVLPEFGVTIQLDGRGRHLLRVGNEGFVPQMHYRMEFGAIALEARANFLMFAGAGSLGFSMQL